MERLVGLRAWVTGGSRGIGEAVAARLAAEGAQVVIAARKPAGVAEAVARLRARVPHASIEGICLHVGDVEGMEAAVDACIEAHGLPHILVNNAATNPHFGPIVTADAGLWRKTFEVNVFGPFELTRQLALRWIDQGVQGRVVFVSSIMGLRAAPFQGVYGATKASLVSLVQTLAVEWGPAGIRVNGLAPGLVDTRFASALTQSPEILQSFTEHTALGRIAEPDEMAGTVAWLVSDDARYVTGQVVAVDGGYLVR
jgi:NAD(P)-dependent dehydrogenase (short-subunit alcohol dehydrogenase family)